MGLARRWAVLGSEFVFRWCRERRRGDGEEGEGEVDGEGDGEGGEDSVDEAGCWDGGGEDGFWALGC